MNERSSAENSDAAADEKHSRGADLAVGLLAHTSVFALFIAANFSLEKLTELLWIGKNKVELLSVISWISDSTNVVLFGFLGISVARFLYKLVARS